MAKEKFYAVKKGKETGIFNNWKDCLESITGFTGAKYKSFIVDLHFVLKFISLYIFDEMWFAII